MAVIEPPRPRKIYQGVASRSRMFALLNRHHQAPFDPDRISGRLYAGEWFEIDAESYHTMLEVLPPLFTRGDCFAMSEFLAGSVTSVFFELRVEGETRWFHAYCDLGRRASTDEMRQAILDRERKAPETPTREECLEHLWSTTPDEFRGYLDGDSRRRTILVFEPTRGTVPILLSDLPNAELSRRLAWDRLPSAA
jgi:hypothetical protein